MEDNYRQILDILIDSAKQVAIYQRLKFKTDFQVSYKQSHSDLVTEIDYTSQEMIQTMILQGADKVLNLSSQLGFIGEENLNQPKKYTVIIDPLDGTTNFASKFPYFSILLTFVVEDQAKIGLIYETMTDDYYFAIKDSGSYYFNSLTGQVEDLKVLEKPVNEWLISGNYFTSRLLSEDFLKQTRGVRVIHGSGLETSLILKNIASIKLAKSPRIWDVIGCKLIMEEAGGVFRTFKNSEVCFNLEDLTQAYSGVMGHPNCVNKFLKMQGKLLDLN